MQQFQHNLQHNQVYQQNTINPQQNIPIVSLDLQKRESQQNQSQIQSPIKLQSHPVEEDSRQRSQRIGGGQKYAQKRETLEVQEGKQQGQGEQDEGNFRILKSKYQNENEEDSAGEVNYMEQPRDDKIEDTNAQKEQKVENNKENIKKKQDPQDQTDLQDEMEDLEEKKSREYIEHQILVELGNQFDWGQQTKCQPRKRSISQFFLKGMQNERETIQDFPSLQKSAKKQGKIQKEEKMQEVDIWEGVREIMLQKSRLSDKGKARNLNGLPPIRKGGSERVDIVNKKSGHQKQKKEIVSNINEISKMILQKMRRWRKQNKEIDERRNKSIEMEAKIKQQEIKNREKAQMKIKGEAAKKIQNKQKATKTSKIQKIEKGEVRTSKTEKTQKSKQKRDKNDKQPKLVEDKQLQLQQGFKLQRSYKSVEYKSEKQKLMRRKLFEHRIKEIPVSVSSSKKLLRQIDIDRSKNPMKYKILRRKGFSDQQIVKMQKQVNIVEPKKIGAKYLQDLRQKNKSDDLRRYMSQEIIIQLKRNERSWKPIHLEEEIQSKESLNKKKENFN